MQKNDFLRRVVTAALALGMAGGMPLLGVDIGLPQAVAQGKQVPIPASVQKVLAQMNAANLTQAQRNTIAQQVMAAVLALPGALQADVLAAAVANVVGNNPNASAGNASAFTEAVAALPPAQRTNAGGAVGQGIGTAVVQLSANPSNAAAVATIVNATSAAPAAISNGVSAGISAAIVASPNPTAAANNVIAIVSTAGVSTASIQAIGTGLGSAVVILQASNPTAATAVNTAVLESGNTTLTSATTSVTAPVLVVATVQNTPISGN